MPASVPHVDELGVTSAPLKSASFFIGEYCKPYNGASLPSTCTLSADCALTRAPPAEDFMLCKAENRDPAHCLAEGRKVTRCAQDLCVPLSLSRPSPRSAGERALIPVRAPSIAKVRSTCLKEFDAHWQCLERNNQVRRSRSTLHRLYSGQRS